MVFYALLTTFSALLLYFFAFERKNRATRLHQKPTGKLCDVRPRRVRLTLRACIGCRLRAIVLSMVNVVVPVRSR